MAKTPPAAAAPPAQQAKPRTVSYRSSASRQHSYIF